MNVVRRPAFLDDLTEAYAYLAHRNPVVADRLLDEVEGAVGGFPEIGRPRHELRPGVRSFRLRGFRHLIFYRVAEDAVVLLRILHGARDTSPETMET